MTKRYTYLRTGNVETTESFFSNELLSARIQSGQESNAGFDPFYAEFRSEDWRKRNWKSIQENDLKYDEDVNQYITLTLADLVNPQNLPLLNQYMVGLNADAGQIAVNLDRASQKYILYRINADYLLLNLGLFNPDTNLLGDAYFDKGRMYYCSASSSLKEAKGGKSGLSDVLDKLSYKFGDYVQILRAMKNVSDNYLSFHFKISDADIKRMAHEVGVEVRKKKES